MIGAAQGLELRLRSGELQRQELTPGIISFLDSLREVSPFIEEDRPLEDELRALCSAIRSEKWSLYEED